MRSFTLFFLLLVLTNCHEATMPAPYGAIPSERQLAWHELQYYGFIHFGLNTYTDKEWGYGDESPALFDPSNLDCNQWARIAKEAGMEGLIITAKHHDGFCLWPTKTTEHSIKNAPWKNGEGDLIKDLKEACEKYDLKLGIYLSPWDRNHKTYGTAAYINVYREQLTELMTNYGDVFEFWMDGANGGDGYYGGANEIRKIDNKTYYDWPNTHKIVRRLQPGAVMFSDGGPDIRWVGNERGYAGETNWATVNKNAFYPGIGGVNDQLESGHEDGDQWLPTEVNTSIRPGWFYHKSQDHLVKSLNQLVDNWFHSVGMNGNFLLNIPPDARGMIHENDEARLKELKTYLDESFSINLAKKANVEVSNKRNNQKKFDGSKAIDSDHKTFWSTDDGIHNASLELRFDQSQRLNAIKIQEKISLGQRIKAFEIWQMDAESPTLLQKGTTIGNRRILKFPSVQTKHLKIKFDSKAPICISNIACYQTKELMAEPKIMRDKDGYVHIYSDSKDPVYYYSINDEKVDTNANLYTSPFLFPEKGSIKAISFLPGEKTISAEKEKLFDIPTTKWKVVRTCYPEQEDWYPIDYLIDGKTETNWFVHGSDSNQACEIIIDLGEVLELTGLNYLPRQDGRTEGNLYKVDISISDDGINFKPMLKNYEISNIKSNPVNQRIMFPKTVRSQYLKFSPKADIYGSKYIGISELSVITKN